MISQPVEITTSLKQGDALYPVLFNIVLEKIIRKINSCIEVTQKIVS